MDSLKKAFKQTKYYLLLVLGFILLYLFPKLCLFYWVCGLIDFGRHGRFNKQLCLQYVSKNGLATWLLSPLNLLIDLLAWSMKPIYQLSELPPDCQREINEVVRAAQKHNVIDIVNQAMKNDDRSMLFFKWYGQNMTNAPEIDDFRQPFKHIRTIGVSVFNKQKSTTRHFGPTRYTLRVLYNLSPIQHDGVYIEVNKAKHYWHDNPMFIFDDTYIHQSFNESDSVRYCLFIDIVRPTLFAHPILDGIVSATRTLMLKFNFIFYQKWTFLN